MNLASVAYADGTIEIYGESDVFANLCVTPEGSYLRPWKQRDTADAYAQCFSQITRAYWGNRCGDYFAVEDATRRIGAWFARYKRKEIRAEFWPPRPAPSPRPSAADRRARASAELFGHMPPEVVR